MPFRIAIFWNFLFGITALIVCYFIWSGVMEIYHYYALSASAKPIVQEWQIRELKNGKYLVAVKYSYEAQGKTWQGETVFPEPKFPNPYAAKESLQTLAPITVWYNPNGKHQPTLYKKFPIILFIRGGVALLIFLYFFGLKRRLKLIEF